MYPSNHEDPSVCFSLCQNQWSGIRKCSLLLCSPEMSSWTAVKMSKWWWPVAISGNEQCVSSSSLWSGSEQCVSNRNINDNGEYLNSIIALERNKKILIEWSVHLLCGFLKKCVAELVTSQTLVWLHDIELSGLSLFVIQALHTYPLSSLQFKLIFSLIRWRCGILTNVSWLPCHFKMWCSDCLAIADQNVLYWSRRILKSD